MTLQPPAMPTRPSPHERRLVQRLLTHWRDRAGDRHFPPAAEIDLAADPEFARTGWIARLDTNGVPFFTVVAPALVLECGPIEGRCLLDLPAATLCAAGSVYYEDVLQRRAPVSIGGELIHRDGRVLLYRSIILPLSEDGETIDHLLGAVSGRPR